MAELVSRKYSRADLEKELGIKGKDLTAFLRHRKSAGCLMSQLDNISPHAKRRERRYFFVATQLSMEA